MTEDKLVGNIATEGMLDYFSTHALDMKINQHEFDHAMNIAAEVFLGR